MTCTHGTDRMVDVCGESRCSACFCEKMEREHTEAPEFGERIERKSSPRSGKAKRGLK